jgi:glutamyl-tRNA synthetase
MHFSLEKVSKTAAIFNKDKLEWINGVYLRKLSPEEFVKQAIPFLDRDLPPWVKRPLDGEYVHQITPLIQERAKNLADIPQLSDFFFLDELQYDTQLLLSQSMDAGAAAWTVQVTMQRLRTVEVWDATSLENILRPLAAELNLSTGKFFGLIRVAITGRTAAPPLLQTMAVLGRGKCLKRLSAAEQKALAVP